MSSRDESRSTNQVTSRDPDIVRVPAIRERRPSTPRPAVALVLAAALLSALPAAPAGAQIAFEHHYISTTFPKLNGFGQSAAGDFKTKVREYETAMILDALEKSQGNQRAAARLLQIPLRTLTSKLELYALRDRIGGKKKS